MKIHSDIIQGSEEWYKIRLGKVTASNFSKVLAKGQGKVRRAYMLKLAAERLTGLPQDTYCNDVMLRGNEVEPQGRAMYKALMGIEVQEVGFVELNEDVGASPDSLIGEDGGLEIKSPNTTTHIEIIIADKMPTKHKAQVQGNMWVTKREWWDFCSFDPRMRSNKMFKIRVYRDQGYIDELQYEVEKFVKELKILVETIGQSPF